MNTDRRRDCCTVEPARSGDATLRVERGAASILLHSSYDPRKEAEEFVASFALQPRDKVLVIGCGLGYHLREILRQQPRIEKLFVFEARPDILRAAEQAVELADIFADPRVELTVDSDEKELMRRIYRVVKLHNRDHKLKLIVHRPSLEVYKKDGTDLTDILEKIYIGPRLQEMMKANFHANLPVVLRSRPVKELFGAYKDKPVILVSAGPSLAADLEALKRLQGKAVIITVSTVLKLLLDNGVRPDFTAIGDPKPIMATHFQEVWDCGVPLIFLPTAAKEVVLRYPGIKYAALQTGYRLCDIVAKKMDKGRVEVGESVSTLMLDVAIRMGGNPIIFVGQDLAFSDGHTHAPGVPKRFRITTATRMVRSVCGEEIPTSSAFCWILHWIEKRIARQPQTVFINASASGARIKGTLEKPLDEVFDEDTASVRG
jgi:hypothetical protein